MVMRAVGDVFDYRLAGVKTAVRFSRAGFLSNLLNKN